LLGALIVYRIGAHIPVPGIDPAQLAEAVPSQQGGILDMFNMFSGGALSRFTIFALGIMPYISASIIMQLLTVVSPQLEALKKEGEAGRRKITQYTRYGTARSLATFQGWRYCRRARVAARWWSIPAAVPVDYGRHAGDGHDVPDVARRADYGARSRQRHFADHFCRHRAGFPQAIGGTLELVRTGSYSIPLCCSCSCSWFWSPRFVVFVERGQRKILVNYAKRQVGQGLRRAEFAPAAEAEHVGRDPADLRLASSCFRRLWPQWFGANENMTWLKNLGGDTASRAAGLRTVVCVGHRVFCFFYTALVFNPKGDCGEPEEERRVCSRHSSG
jgi:preprotein translocase subunit SecY